MKGEQKVRFRKFDRVTDYLLQRKLFLLSFPETAGTETSGENHYDWKFGKFPATVPSYEFVATVAEASENLTGYYAALPYEYKIGNSRVKCGMVCDVMTHPAYRGLGIFTGIGKFATEDLEKQGLGFVSGYPIRPEVIPGHLKVGWKIVQQMPMYLRLVGFSSFLPGPLKFISHFLNPILNLLQFWTHFFPGNYETAVVSVSEFLQLKDYDRFLSLWLNEQKNALVKSKDFLEWRTSAPGTDYRFVVLKSEGQLVGCSLVRPTQIKGIESLAILDMAILSSAYKGSRNLHSEIYKLAVFLKKDVVVCMASRKWAKAYRFLRSCYFPTFSAFNLIIKKLNASIADQDLYESDPWHLFWIDSDDL